MPCAVCRCICVDENNKKQFSRCHNHSDDPHADKLIKMPQEWYPGVVDIVPPWWLLWQYVQ